MIPVELTSQPASTSLSGSWQNLEGDSRTRRSNLFSTPQVTPEEPRGATRGIAETLLGQQQQQQQVPQWNGETSPPPPSESNPLLIQVIELTSVLESMQTKIVDLESNKDMMEARARDNFAESVQQNAKLLEDREWNMNMMSELKDEVDRLRTQVGKPQQGAEDRKDRDGHDSKGGKQDSYAYFVTKSAEHFPVVDAKRCETELQAWDQYWEAIVSF